MSIENNNKRIAKNTIFLYLRMFIMMGVSLYTSRVILNILGIEDFGIYNVVAGVVVLFTFVNNAMAIASQRFLSYALGKYDDEEVTRVFSMSFTSHMVIAIIVLVLAESIGLLLLYEMNFPSDRHTAVLWSYQFAILTCIAQIIRVPYNATIIAYESMSFYAWVSICEVVLKLVVVYLLLIYGGDKLIFYSILLFIVTVGIDLVYKKYCNRRFRSTIYHFYWDSKRFKEFLNFSGWSLAGSLANISASQGLNMIINIFFGVSVNAAVGISNQVMGAVGQFLGNFQTAFNPQLVKSYANGDKDGFMNLIFKASKFSYYLMFVVSLPVILYCDFALNVWLSIVPEYAVEFSRLMIIFLLIDAISGPLWISVQATGKIKKYQMLMAFLIFLNLPLAYIVLYSGYSPVYAFLIRVLVNIITLFARIIYLRPLIQLPTRKYFINVLGPLIIVTLLAMPFPWWLRNKFDIEWINVVFISLISIINTSAIIYLVGLSKTERYLVKNLILRKLKIG